jgi:hypothetical protein
MSDVMVCHGVELYQTLSNQIHPHIRLSSSRHPEVASSFEECLAFPTVHDANILRISYNLRHSCASASTSNIGLG